MTIKEAREEAGLTQKEVYQILEIPVRTQQNWESGLRICPIYVEKLIVEKLLSLKKSNATKVNIGKNRCVTNVLLTTPNTGT